MGDTALGDQQVRDSELGAGVAGERYRPYRRSARKERQRRRNGEENAGPRPAPPPRAAGVRLYWFPPTPERSGRARRRFLLLVLAAVVAWGVVSVRRGDVELNDLRGATTDIAASVPHLVAEAQVMLLELRRRVFREDRPKAEHEPLPTAASGPISAGGALGGVGADAPGGTDERPGAARLGGEFR